MMYLKITEQMGTIVDNTAVSKSKLQTLQVTYPTRTFCSLNHSVKNNIYRYQFTLKTEHRSAQHSV